MFFLLLVQALWEGLALNIVHCEVETREGFGKVKSATSSSAPTSFHDEDTWGGDSAHWIALRELGKLAMLSNTLPGTGEVTRIKSNKNCNRRLLLRDYKCHAFIESFIVFSACPPLHRQL